MLANQHIVALSDLLDHTDDHEHIDAIAWAMRCVYEINLLINDDGDISGIRRLRELLKGDEAMTIHTTLFTAVSDDTARTLTLFRYGDATPIAQFQGEVARRMELRIYRERLMAGGRADAYIGGILDGVAMDTVMMPATPL